LAYRPEGYLRPDGGLKPALHQFYRRNAVRRGGRDDKANVPSQVNFRGVVNALIRRVGNLPTVIAKAWLLLDQIKPIEQLVPVN